MVSSFLQPLKQDVIKGWLFGIPVEMKERRQDWAEEEVGM